MAYTVRHPQSNHRTQQPHLHVANREDERQAREEVVHRLARPSRVELTLGQKALVWGLGFATLVAGARVVQGGIERATGPSMPLMQNEYTVQPNDTLWSIAERFNPNEDPRPVVDVMSAARNGAPLQPGEVVMAPGLSLTAEAGDNPISIARRYVGEEGDPRPLSDAIQEAAGRDGLQQGEHIVLTAQQIREHS